MCPQFETLPEFEEGHAVQYFYEPFLEAYDPELRKELGVWYTPPEVVRYMVARVDAALRTELGVADGLADPQVYVLDPCAGTGAYLVEVLRCIADTLSQRGEDALLGEDLKRAAATRLFGFEILPAPFVIAHLQLGLLLQKLGAPLSEERQERVGVYLTNALTGWEPPQGPKQHLLFSELEAERDAAERVKQKVPILVVLGNPPYNGFAGMAVAEERSLSDAYRITRRAPAPQGQGLNDLYVRFYRMAERRIAEQTGQGIVCFISNYSWLDGLSYTGMRERYLEAFDRVRIDCLNGDKYKTGKLTPEGEPDPSIFSTEFNREGIQVGTAIALLVRKQSHAASVTVQFRHLWGKGKRAQLLANAGGDEATEYQEVQPDCDLGLPFMPMQLESAYLSWPLLPDVFPLSFPGIQTGRDDVLVDIERDHLDARMRLYFDPHVSDEALRASAPQLITDTVRFDAKSTRGYLIRRGYLPQNIVRFSYRPFDLRWLYWEPDTDLLDRKRSDYFVQVRPGNIWLAAAQRNRKDFDPPLVCKQYSCRHVVERGANLFPLFVYPTEQTSMFLDVGVHEADSDGVGYNLAASVAGYLRSLDDAVPPADVFYHTIAVLHSSSFRSENAGALRQDWPRIPLPNSAELLMTSAALGKQVARLLDTESGVPGVTTGTVRSELRTIATVARVAAENAAQPAPLDLRVNAGWGHPGKDGITMPGKGRMVTRACSAAERAALAQGAGSLGLSVDQVLQHLGETTCDVYLNDTVFWRNVPVRVWEYTIGGYQVIKKWLSYREHDLLGRPLSPDEAREVTQMVRRIAAILLLEPALDANYQAVKAATYAWPSGEQAR